MNSHSAAEKSSRCVLVVEDEPLIRWSVAETLGEDGWTVIEAESAATALRAIEDSGKIDVVLLDFRLPDTHDLSLLETVRRLMPASPVVLMTAHGTPELADRALALGAYRVVNKPFDMREISTLIRAASDSRAAH